MKMEKALMYGIPIVVGGAIIYYLVTRPPAVPAATVPTPAQVGIPSLGPVAVPGVVKTGIQGELMAMAMNQLGLPASEIVIRSLRPQDIGLTSFNHTSTGANVWDNFASATVADNTFISFDGVSYGGTNFSQMRINAGARAVEYWPLAWIAGLRSQVFYDTSPSIAQQNQPVIIDINAKAVATENVSIMGTVAEKRGLVIG